MLFKLLVVIIKVTELFWKNVCVRSKVEDMLAEFFLHADDVETHSVFAGDLVARRELVDLLILIKAFILVALDWAT